MNGIKWEEGVEPELEAIGDSAFYHDGQFAKLQHIPSLKTLGAGVFIKNANLLEVHIPANCTIGDKAFFECLALQNVYSYGMTPPVIADDAFKSIYYLDEAVLHVDKNAVEAYKKADGWRHFKHYETGTVTAIGSARAGAGSAIRVVGQSNGYTVEGLNAGQRFRHTDSSRHSQRQQSVCPRSARTDLHSEYCRRQNLQIVLIQTTQTRLRTTQYRQRYSANQGTFPMQAGTLTITFLPFY